MIDNITHRKINYDIRLDTIICLFLSLVTFVVYWQVTNHEFINTFDDNLYVTNNRYVKSGLTPESILWSFSFKDKDKSYWHPLTWLSHMLDCHLYGLRPGMHHLTSLVIHVANSILLFLVFRRMTGAIWHCAFIAALFALHPLNVDSVAWVAERKNVLSTFFWMLTMLTYAHYCKHPGPSRYLRTFLIFTLGLLAKPMLITLPFVLLLLDYWPLGRLRQATIPSVLRLVVEKVPFVFVSGVSIYLSISSLEGADNMISFELVPMTLRIYNALVSYIGYIEKMVWPLNLAVLYPYPSSIPFWKVACSLLLLIFTSLLVVLAIKKRAYLSVGWFWFLGTLVPSIGLVQAGLWPAMADRWAYIPLIGLFIMTAWGIPDLLEQWRYKKTGLAIIGPTALSILTAITLIQVRYWGNSVALFEHALNVTNNNSAAHINLGVALKNQGKITEAISQFSEALRINPKSATAHYNLGFVLANQNRLNEAIGHYREALRTNPAHERANFNLGIILADFGRYDKALKCLSKALQINPDNADAYNNMGSVLAKQGKLIKAVKYFSKALLIDPDNTEAHFNMGNAMNIDRKTDKAIFHYSEVIRVNPDHFGAHKNLGSILATQDRTAEAITHYTKALSISPDDGEALNDLAWIYSTSKNPRFRNGVKAIQLAEHACEITGYKNPAQLDTLAAAYAETGLFKEARSIARKALQLAESAGEKKLAQDVKTRLELYLSGKPFYDG